MTRIAWCWLYALGLLGLAAPAAAYQFQCSWQITDFDSNGCASGYQRSDSCGCEVGAAPRWWGDQLHLQVENEAGNGISAADFLRAASESAMAWSTVSCSTMRVDAIQTLAANSAARWGENSDERGIFWVSSESEWIAVTGSGAGATLAVTVSPFSGGCANRAFYDTDIVVNGFLPGGWNFALAKTIVMHEMGHSLGLGHTCLLGDPSPTCANSCTALMAGSPGTFQTPQQDDIDGLCALYPGTPGGFGAACTGSGGCNSAPICVTYQGFSYCTHVCGSCETGYTCRNVDGQNVCVRLGAPATGDACTSVCEAGAICVIDSGTPPDATSHCHRACNLASPDCGADRCVELVGGGGVCWPAGTLQLGERCANGSGNCGTGLVCVNDPGASTSIAYCYRSCDDTQPSSCGSDAVCVGLTSSGGFCYHAAGPGQDCEATAYYCVDGYECTPDGNGHLCHRSCNYNDSTSCGAGETCIEFVDPDNNPLFGACFPQGDNNEGEPCISHYNCATGLVCAATPSGAGECLVVCNPAAPSCPHAGQQCTPMVGSSDGMCTPAGGDGSDAGPGRDSSQPRDGGAGSDPGSASDSGVRADVTVHAGDVGNSGSEAACGCTAVPESATGQAAVVPVLLMLGWLRGRHHA